VIRSCSSLQKIREILGRAFAFVIERERIKVVYGKYVEWMQIHVDVNKCKKAGESETWHAMSA